MLLATKNTPSPILSRVQRKVLTETVQAFDVATRRRGTQYLLDGRVEEARFQSNTITACVRGSTVYRVIWSGKRGEWWNECTCPVGYNCKHTYAVAQHVLQHGFSLEDGKQDLLHNGQSWNIKIDRLLSMVKKRKKEISPSEVRSHSIVSQILDARSSWDALQCLPTLFAQLGLRTEASNRQWLSFLESDQRPKRAWLLARELLKYGDRLPPELEPYRCREDFEKEELEKKEETLVASLQSWVHTLSSQPPQFQRSIRVVWSWDQSSALGDGPRITFLLRSKKLKDAPRTFQQIRSFASEAARSPYLFNSEDTDFLRWLDSQYDSLIGHSSHYSETPSASLTVRAHGLYTWLVAWGQSQRCVWEDGSPVRYESGLARILPEISLSGGLGQSINKQEKGEPSLRFVVEIPDGKRFSIQQVRVVLPKGENPFKEPTFVFVSGVFYRVTSPPRSVLLSFLEGRELPLSVPRRKILLSPLLTWFPYLIHNVKGLVCYHPTRICFTFVLDSNEWLCVRLFAVSRKSDFRWEFTGKYWVRCDPESLKLWDSSMIRRIYPVENPAASSSIVESGTHPQSETQNHESEMEGDCDHLPDPTETGPAQEWLKSLGMQTAEDSGRKGEYGWWTFLNGKDIEVFFERWALRPISAECWGNTAFHNLFVPARRLWPRVKIQSSGMDWFSISADWGSLAENLTAADFKRLSDPKEAFIKLSNGHWIKREEVDEFKTTLEILANLGVDPTVKEIQRLTWWQFARADQQSLRQWLELLEAEGDSETRLVLDELRTRLAAFQGLPEVMLPHRLRASMRPYQIEGLKFLTYVSSLKLGAILADDMGLGKTLQALAWMEHLRDLGGAAPCLVVCPASVVYNWQREADKFVPGTKTLLLTSGEARHRLRKEIPKHDLVITNYALLRRDLEELKQFEFRAVVLDEAQNIKNPDSLVARASKQLKVMHRLALTGTPLENRLTDLWSIADFVTPGYLGTRNRFSETYDVPDQPHRRRLLAARLRPILLRRIKREVAPDLPERIEERQDCELTEQQRLLYVTELQRAREMVASLGDGQTLLRKKIHILAALTRLRQICCHPALVGGKPEIGSGKTAVLFDILEPLIAEGHKVLVFSQFVRMLSLLQHELKAQAIPYYLLTGQSVKREAIVDLFQQDSRACVFLLSLRAAGTGLNLTAASYVVLYDPWWNPAVEAQAIDRTHRIGQDRTVITYRLVTKNTVEDKIYELQQKKASMVQDVLGEEGFARSLTRDDLQYLFED